MKSVFNKIVRAAQPEPITVSQINDTQISNPQNDDVLIYENGLWRNSKIDYNDLLNRPNIPNILNDLTDVTISSLQQNHTIIYNGSQWENRRQFMYLTNIVSNGSNTFQVAPDTFYSLSSSANLQMTSPILLSGGRRVLVLLLNGGRVTFPNGIFLDQSTNFFLSCPITEMAIIEFISSGSDRWVLGSFSGNIVRSDTQKALCNNNLNDLRDLNISNPNDDQYIGFNSNTFKYINRTLNNDYNEVIFVTNGGLTAQYNKLYICNNAAIDMPIPENGRCIKIINLAGPTVVINFTNRILWHYSNFFNINLQSTNACYIEFVAINNAWQVKSFTGRWVNSATSLGLAQTQINDIRGVSLSGPTVEDILCFNGTNWINKKFDLSWHCNSNSNINANQFFFINSLGMTNTETPSQLFISNPITISRIDIWLSSSPGVGNTRNFLVRVNTLTQTTLSITGLNVTGSFPVSLNLNNPSFLSIQATNTGSPSAAIGKITIIYNYR